MDQLSLSYTSGDLFQVGALHVEPISTVEHCKEVTQKTMLSQRKGENGLGWKSLALFNFNILFSTVDYEIMIYMPYL